MNSPQNTQPANPARNPQRGWWLVLIVLTLLLLNACVFLSDDQDDDQGGTSPMTSQEPITREKLGALIREHEDRHLLSFHGLTPGPPFPSSVKMTWVPPAGATNVRFYDQEPDNPNGPPPYVWSQVPVNPTTGTTPDITVAYDPPWPPLDYVVDTLTVESGGAQASESVRRRGYGWNLGQGSAQDRRPATPPTGLGPAQDDYYVWEVSQLHHVNSLTMTTSLCQDLVDFWQSDTTFFAVRFPVQPPTLAYTGAYTLPVVFQGSYSPTWKLVQYNPDATVFTGSLEYKPEHFTFLANELPSARGEHWLALGAKSSPSITCPQGLDTRDWEFETHFYLDFGGVQDTCAGCVLPVYYCYEGEDEPFAGALLAQTFGEADITSYQGWGLTCLGPQPLTLSGSSGPDPAFELGKMHMAWITQTQTISVVHALQNDLGAVPVTVTLDYSSTLGLPWGIYSGDWTGPDIPLVPITNPVYLGSSPPDYRRIFWMIVQVPAGTPDGPETLIINATDVYDPANAIWTSDLLWVGEWVPPPPAPFWHQVYLPVVMESSNQ